jgi:hypothetical protein
LFANAHEIIAGSRNLEALSLFGRQTLTTRYWTESLQVTDADLEALFSVMLEGEKPLTGREMVRMFIERRLRQEEERWQKRLSSGDLFQPKNSYTVGDKLVFPALDFALGEVVGSRAGASPENGEFTVIEVEFEGRVKREFASDLQTDHKLNVEMDGGSAIKEMLEPVDIQAIERRFGNYIYEELQDHLDENDDVAYAAGLWFLKSLLPDVNEGHINLAEAILDMHGGGPLRAEDILPIIELPKEINPTLQGFAVNFALYHDKRFDEVGPAGMVKWYLKRLEPTEVQETPEILTYDPIPYSRELLSPELLALEAEINDELSPLEEPDEIPDEVTLTLVYPHRRAGTLPLTANLSAMFPTAYEAERILVTLVDDETDEAYEGWVARGGRYVVGLERFYRKYKLPIGAYVTIHATDDPGQFILSFDGYRPRTEWITLVSPQNNRMTFQNHKRSIGAAYDDLMILGVEELQKIDQIREETQKRQQSLVQTIRGIMPELARLNPQSAVHAKTLYSAVNIVRRCPPGPILAVLESQPDFEAVGGHYWRYNADA